MVSDVGISIPNNIRPYIEEISHRLWSGHAVLMVGSGFSKNAKPVRYPSTDFPDWSEVGDAIYERLYGYKPDEHNKYLSVPGLAFEMESTLSPSSLEDFLKNIIPDTQFQPSLLHIKLLELPWSDVFTTNFDTLLERASKSVNSYKYDVVVNKGDLGSTKRPRIVKLHGSFPSDGPFIITEEHYRQYPDTNAHFVNTVHQALLENTLCLLGFSGHDPNFLRWIGWIRDALGQRHSPKIYSVGLHDISEPEQKSLEQKNIVLVDLAEWQDVKNDHYRALDRFLDTLLIRGKKENQDEVQTAQIEASSGVDWPVGNDWKYPKSEMAKTEQLTKLTTYWRKQRRSYPGWVTVPIDRRSSLWFDTEHWCGFVSVEDDLPTLIDLEFAFELSWRMEKCLCPFYENQIQFFESIIDKYIPLADENSSFSSHNIEPNKLSDRGLATDDVRNMVRRLLLQMFRFYREEGLLDKWSYLFERISEIENQLPPELEAYFYYEQSLFALFNLDFSSLREILARWPENVDLQLWEIKKAGLYTEIGADTEARTILNKALSHVRSKQKSVPEQLVISLASQETLILKLLDASDFSEAWTKGNVEEYQDSTQRTYLDKLESLKQYKCDPQAELRFFESTLNQQFVRKPEVTRKEEFDLGRYTQNFRLSQPAEILVAFNFLRFCEDSGLPFRVSGIGLSKETAGGALTRILGFSPFWAMATLFRIGDGKVVDQVFSRSFMSEMTTSTVDELAYRYLSALEQSIDDISHGDVLRDNNIGTVIAKVIPEVLSRMCSKCSLETKNKLVNFLLYVYKSENRRKYVGIRNLTERLLNSIPVKQRFELIPTLLDFPILDELTPIEELEYVNPFRLLKIDRESVAKLKRPSISSDKLDGHFESACTGNADARKWSLHTLGELYDLGCLNDGQSSRYADALWSQVDEFGLPTGTDYRKAYFYELPHPNGIRPFAQIKRYIRTQEFPIQKNTKGTGIQLNGLNIPICQDIIRSSQYSEWTYEDSLVVLDRLVDWWDADKAYLRKVEAPGPFGTIRDEFEARFTCLVNVGVEILKPGYKFNEKKAQLRRVLDELSDNCIPALRLESACIDLFPDSSKNTIQKVESGLASEKHESVIDSLRAVLIIATKNTTKLYQNEFLKVLNTLGQMIRFQKGPSLSSVIKTIAILVSSHPWTFCGEFERLTLVGLDNIRRSTVISAVSQEVSELLTIRQHAASFAYKLYMMYIKHETTLPKVVHDWRSVCASEREFAEIRNQWIS